MWNWKDVILRKALGHFMAEAVHAEINMMKRLRWRLVFRLLFLVF